MKKITLKMLLLLAFSTFNLNAQIWSIPSCSQSLGTTVYGPMFSTASGNATNRTAIIYPASQLSGISGQTLNKMFFKRNTAAGTMAGTPNFKIYLKEVTISDFGAADLNWASEIAAATLVYDSNPVAAVGSTAGWKGFDLTTPFLFSGTQNLAVYFEYNNPSSSTTITWDYEYSEPCITRANTNTSKYLNVITGVLPVNLNTSNYRRTMIGFNYVVSCPQPTNLTATGITATSVNLNWTIDGAETQWEYIVLPTGSPAPIATTVGTLVTTNSAAVSNLSPITAYQVYVRAVCSGTDKSFWTGPTTFDTSVIPGCATVIAPLDGTTGIKVGSPVPFSWTAPTTGDPATSYDIFYGPSPTAVTTLLGNYTTTSTTLSVNNYNTTFYWKLVPKNAGGSAVGCSIYSFTSEASPGYCLLAPDGLYPATTFTPTVCDGTTAQVIIADGYSSEYSQVNVIAGNTYQCISVNNSTTNTNDFITISNDGGATATAYGISPLTWIAKNSGVIRFYSHLDNNCSLPGPTSTRARSIICTMATLGIKSFDLSGFSSFPNPIIDVLNLSYTDLISKVAIHNLLGEEIKSQNINATTAKIDMSDLSSGTYFAKVSVGDFINTIKVVKE
jgi:hypothetical protein